MVYDTQTRMRGGAWAEVNQGKFYLGVRYKPNEKNFYVSYYTPKMSGGTPLYSLEQVEDLLLYVIRMNYKEDDEYVGN